jgi:hypothetical protein
MSSRVLMKIKIEDIIDMTDKVDNILHDYGFVVSHDLLSTYLLKTIRESYPNDDMYLENPDMTKLIKKVDGQKNR